MDEPDIPMLDVGDFEVLDEYLGEDDNEDEHHRSYEYSEVDVDDSEDEDDSPRHRGRGGIHRRERLDPLMDDYSTDNVDNILDVSIDVAENEFLESVAKDFSENIEDEVEVIYPKKYSTKRIEPTVQLKKINITVDNNQKESEGEKVEKVEEVVIKKKPGPRCKTMNIQHHSTPKTTPGKEDKINKGVSQDQKASTSSSKKSNEKGEQIASNKTPAFLKKDLTDEEIMIHFDEIENTVLTSDSFVIQNEVDQAEKEKKTADESKEDVKEDEDKRPAQNEEEENWDDDAPAPKKVIAIVEREELKESEMWYKEKILAKENVFEEKLTKLAKIIQYSYPLYKTWFDKNESLFGTAICKIDPPKHSPLDQLYPNRWKFICNKKQTQQSAKEEEKLADNASNSKSVQLSWQVIPGVSDANVENTEDYPPFVMRVVKIFEDFLNSLESSSTDQVEIKKEEEEVVILEDDEHVENSFKSKEDEKQETDNDNANENYKSLFKNPDGLTMLIRCNQKEDLMMHITGKNISSELMEKIKELFETGSGKDCNVKSVYCKTITKLNNVIKTNTTFLMGSETLDDTIGSVKVQLAPKTNVWANLAGVEVLANVVADYLVPSKKTTIIEIGCGTGLISLLLASKCQKIIGLDVQKEIVEAEITCELNNITNATFVTGKPKFVMAQIEKDLNNSKAVAVINTNNAFGRSVDVISALRKMSTLGKIVIITTLTKQAIRSILELTHPANNEHGNPFIPIKACIVDTTPKNYGFEIVISMERRTMRNILKWPLQDGANPVKNPVGLISKSKQVAAMKYNEIATTNAPFKKFVKNFKAKGSFIVGKKFFPTGNFNPVNNKFQQTKRPFHGNDAPFPAAKKFKQFEKPWLGPNVRVNPIFDKKLRDVDQGDLREKLSNNRIEPTAIAQQVQDQKKLLDEAKERLTNAASSVDADTVKKLQEMLHLAIEKTNKLQSQLPPRSVWDRIAPPDTGAEDDDYVPNSSKGRIVKEAGSKNIIITSIRDINNRDNRDLDSEPTPTGKSKKYYNLPPLEPNMMSANNKPNRLKMNQPIQQKPNSAPYQKPGPNRFQGGNYRKQNNNQNSDSWARGKQQQSSYSLNEFQDKWNRPSPPRRSSPPRALLRSPPRQSPPRRNMSPARRQMSPPRRMLSSPRRMLSPPRRPVSPPYRQHSSRPMNNSNRQNSPPRRHNSPPRRLSPPRQNFASSRQKSPPQTRRFADDWDIPSRGAIAESGWNRQEREKSPWQNQSQSGWNQGGNSSSNSNRYRSDDKWDNSSSGSNWGNKNPVQVSQNSNSKSRWKMSSNNSIGATNWDVEKKDVPVRDPFGHESRHEPRRDLLDEMIIWGIRNKSFDRRNEKEDWNDLPEDARDPWDDHSTPQKDLRWNNQSIQSQPATWSREKGSENRSSDNWQSKSSYGMNSIGSSSSTNNLMNVTAQNPNMTMSSMGTSNIAMNNPNKPLWQAPPQQQNNRNSNWLPPGNWQSGSGSNSGLNTTSGAATGAAGLNNSGVGGVGISPHLLGNTLSNWQPAQQQQQNFSNFSSRAFNNLFATNNSRR